MTFSFQDPGTHPPSFLCGFAENTEEKDGFQACQRAGFKDTASLEFMKMMDEVKHHTEDIEEMIIYKAKQSNNIKPSPRNQE